jgi:hypothetical protein
METTRYEIETTAQHTEDWECVTTSNDPEAARGIAERLYETGHGRARVRVVRSVRFTVWGSDKEVR